MGDFCNDNSLMRYRPNIMNLLPTGILTWASQINQAEAEVLRILERRWYQEAAREQGLDYISVPFDKDKILDAASASAEEPDTQITNLCAFKALALIYEYLGIETADASGFERYRDHFAKRFTDELRVVLEVGVSYDWDASGEFEQTEAKQRVPRVTYRM